MFYNYKIRFHTYNENLVNYKVFFVSYNAKLYSRFVCTKQSDVNPIKNLYPETKQIICSSYDVLIDYNVKKNRLGIILMHMYIPKTLVNAPGTFIDGRTKPKTRYSITRPDPRSIGSSKLSLHLTPYLTLNYIIL